jgi:hypothetical protein
MEIQTDKDFYKLIQNIRKRQTELFSGYWFNLIKYKDCTFIQGNMDVGDSEYGVNRNLAVLTDDITAEDIKEFCPEISGHPIDASEESLLVDYLRSRDPNEVELVVPERNRARPVEWGRFDEAPEYKIYKQFIYPAIINAIENIESHESLNKLCL